MNKDEAIKAMKSGKIVRHRSFTDIEWVKWNGLKYEFEDGVKVWPEHFWEHRTHKAWETDWSIVE